VVSLDSSDEILGLRANDSHIYVLCRKMLYAVRVISDEQWYKVLQKTLIILSKVSPKI